MIGKSKWKICETIKTRIAEFAITYICTMYSLALFSQCSSTLNVRWSGYEASVCYMYVEKLEKYRALMLHMAM